MTTQGGDVESDLPWIPAALRALLLADPDFDAASYGRVSTKAPSDVEVPFALARVMTNSLLPLGGGGYKVLVQVDGHCPSSGYGNEEAEKIVWRMADRAKRVFQQARNINYQTMYYRLRPVGLGPLPQDVSRGESNPLERAAVRAEMTIHNT